MSKHILSPLEISKELIELGYKKAIRPTIKLLLLGILAGAFIAFAAQGSNVAVHTIDSLGIAKTIAGAVFSTGLILVVVAGAELFTGNCLMDISFFAGRTKFLQILRNWTVVYLGNLIGSLIIVGLIRYSGQLDFSNGLLGAYTIKVASYKVGLNFTNAFIMGVLCNWLVCLAVWMSIGAKDITGKILSIFFPIWVFIISGFEHSVANMYYIPIGILAKSNPIWVQEALNHGISVSQLEALNWSGFIHNLIPVTLGNMVGGGLFVGGMYWLIYLYKGEDDQTKIETDAKSAI